MSDTVVKVPFDFSGYLQKVTKLVPTEIVVLYTAALALLPMSLTAQLIVIGLCVVLTPLYLMFTLKVKNVIQVVLSTLSFAVYAVATGGALTTASWYQSWIPGVVLVLYSFIVPMFVKPTEVAAPVTAAKTTAKKKILTKSWREI